MKHVANVAHFQHDHDTSWPREVSERRTRIVLGVTVVVMVAELVAGTWTRSLALTADGWHMATHAGAFSLAAFGYWFARTRAKDARFTFGTGKVYALSGFASAAGLAVIALLMVVESIQRLAQPETIAYREALPVAALGLLVNLLSLALLGAKHDHDHAHDHDHDHDHAHHDHAHHDHDHDHAHEHGKHDDHHDHNLRGVYLHVLADSATSVFALAALSLGALYGWRWLDPVMALVGAALILHWARGLLATTSRQLLDAVPSAELEIELRKALEAIDDVRVADFHLWDIGPGRRACIAVLVTHTPKAPSFYRSSLSSFPELAHVTIEVHACPDDHPA